MGYDQHENGAARERGDILSSAEVRKSAGSGVDAVANLLADRYSCRAFLPQRIPEADLAKLLALAQRSPS